MSEPKLNLDYESRPLRPRAHVPPAREDVTVYLVYMGMALAAVCGLLAVLRLSLSP
jgi:hypothetical protein